MLLTVINRSVHADLAVLVTGSDRVFQHYRHVPRMFTLFRVRSYISRSEIAKEAS
jgi:hypothetical protein